MDDSTSPAELDGLRDELVGVLAELVTAVAAAPGMLAAERAVRDGVHAVGARLLAAGLAARGTGQAGPRLPCRCGATARVEGDRPKGVQTLVGWVRLGAAAASL